MRRPTYILLILLVVLSQLLLAGCGCMTIGPAKNTGIYIDPDKKTVKTALEMKKKNESIDNYEYIEYDTAADLFYSAGQKFKKKEYSIAFRLYEQIIQQFPEDILVEDSMVYQARIFYLREFFKRAAKKYDQIVLIFPNTRFKEECMYYAYLSFRELKYEKKAKKRQKKFVKAFPKSPYTLDIIYYNAGELYDNKEYKKALASYMKYYMKSKKKIKKKKAFTAALDIINNILTSDELLAIADDYTDTFPAAYIKYNVAKLHLTSKNIHDAKSLLLEIDEFFPDFEHIENVREHLSALTEKIKRREETNPDVIACLLPLTGKYGAYGQRMLAGIMLAVEVFAEKEFERPITIVVKNTAGDPDTALKMLDEAYEKDKAIAVVGPLLSKTANVCAKRAEELKIPIMLLSQKENVTENLEYSYRKFITNSKQVHTLVNYATDVRGLTRFALLYPDNKYGRQLNQLIFDEVINKGGHIVAAESYEPGKSDFTPEIKKLIGTSDLEDRKRLRAIRIAEVMAEEKLDMEYMIKTGQMTEKQVKNYLLALKKELYKMEYKPIVDFEAIFIPTDYSTGGLLIPQLLYHDIDKNVLKLGTSTFNTTKILDIAQGNADGVVFVDGFFNGSADEDVIKFVNEYKGTFERAPGLFEAEAYDSARILLKLLWGKVIQDREELKEALDALKNYKGVTGTVREFKDGDAIEDLLILTFRRNKIKQILLPKKPDTLVSPQ